MARAAAARPLVRVYPTELVDDADQPPLLPSMAGQTGIDATGLWFAPRFGFVPGTSYTVFVEPAVAAACRWPPWTPRRSSVRAGSDRRRRHYGDLPQRGRHPLQPAPYLPPVLGRHERRSGR